MFQRNFVISGEIADSLDVREIYTDFSEYICGISKNLNFYDFDDSHDIEIAIV